MRSPSREVAKLRRNIRASWLVPPTHTPSFPISASTKTRPWSDNALFLSASVATSSHAQPLPRWFSLALVWFSICVTCSDGSIMAVIHRSNAAVPSLRSCPTKSRLGCGWRHTGLTHLFLQHADHVAQEGHCHRPLGCGGGPHGAESVGYNSPWGSLIKNAPTPALKVRGAASFHEERTRRARRRS